MPSRIRRPVLHPSLRRVAVPIRLPAWLSTWLQTQPNKGRTIEDALIAMHKLAPPDAKPVAPVPTTWTRADYDAALTAKLAELERDDDGYLAYEANLAYEDYIDSLPPRPAN